MNFVITYDIEDDRRRLEVAEYLLRYGERVQYSCFEVSIFPETLVELVSFNLRRLAVGEFDRVFLYPISKFSGKYIIRFSLGIRDAEKSFKELLELFFNQKSRLLRFKYLSLIEDDLDLQIKIGRFKKYLIIYDLEDGYVRNRFSKFLSQFGFRAQLSVFEIEAVPSALTRIILEARKVSRYGKVYIYPLDERSYKRIIRIGKPYSPIDGII